MLKKILKVEGTRELNKKEQAQISGGVDPETCENCGGFPTPNGDCFGDQEVCFCVYGFGSPECNF
ncbi:hypothetical protein EZY14_005480 [Kordia sp. TARA_039_SRF]|nr:hypothetical protein EZY14_005480 [Kordia sp. TARA_039_SRF]